MQLYTVVCLIIYTSAQSHRLQNQSSVLPHSLWAKPPGVPRWSCCYPVGKICLIKTIFPLVFTRCKQCWHVIDYLLFPSFGDQCSDRDRKSKMSWRPCQTFESHRPRNPHRMSSLLRLIQRFLLWQVQKASILISRPESISKWKYIKTSAATFMSPEVSIFQASIQLGIRASSNNPHTGQA